MNEFAIQFSPQERRCITLVCNHLALAYGGQWRIVQSLDDEHKQIRSPEGIVTNGTMTAAIEVKRITGDKKWNDYSAQISSLDRSLVPPCGGAYVLTPPAGFLLPIDSAFARRLRRQISRVAPTLSVGETGGVRVPAHGRLRCGSLATPGRIWCVHDGNTSGAIIRDLSSQVLGRFMLMTPGSSTRS